MTGALTFVRVFLRRDRWVIVWWAVGLAVLYVSQAVSVDRLYTSQADFDQAAQTMAGNAAYIAMAGPARALNTTGGQTAWQSSAFGAVLVGLMSMALVGRHTRAEEESGRDELLRASAVGRTSTTTAAVVVALLANLVVGLAVGFTLVAYGLAFADSMGLGLGLTAVGWVFTGTALVAAQLSSSNRGAWGLAGVVLAVSYVLRAVGDVGNGVASWFSPIGWYQAMHAFSGLRWWPVLLMLAAGAVALAAGAVLFDRRDFGAGLWATRPGPARAPAGLRSPFGLGWRLQRAGVVGWVLGLFFIGLAYGGIGNDVGSLIGTSDTTRKLFVQAGGDLVSAFFATSLLMMGLMVGAFAITTATRPRSEEDAGRVEVLLAAGASRRRWILAQVLVTVLAVPLALVASGAGVGVGYLLVTGDLGRAWSLSWPVVQYVPAVLVLSGVVRLLYGVAPRLVALAWAPLGLVAVVMLFGELLRLPQWLQDLSPFEHLPLVPAQPFAWGPVLAVGAVALALSAAGQVAFTRRDVG